MIMVMVKLQRLHVNLKGLEEGGCEYWRAKRIVFQKGKGRLFKCACAWIGDENGPHWPTVSRKVDNNHRPAIVALSVPCSSFQIYS